MNQQLIILYINPCIYIIELSHRWQGLLLYVYAQFDAGTQKLLDNAERYALYLAEALDDDDRRRRVWQTNNMGKRTNIGSLLCWY